jgi:leucyl aminopeptidase
MKTSIVKKKLEEVDAPILVLGVAEGSAKLPTVIQRLVKDIMDLGDFRGKKGEHTLIYTQGRVPTKRLKLIGLGDPESHDAENLRNILGEASRRIRDLGVETVAVSLEHVAGNMDPGDAAEAFILGGFKDPYHKTRELDEFKAVKELQIVSPRAGKEHERKAVEGTVIAEAVNMCRRLAWGPGNRVTPTVLAEEALKLRELGVEVQVLDREAAEKAGLHSFLAVARGTEEPPKFIVMEYNGKDGAETVAVIGKGITFDTGGISLKSRDGMPLMKTNMTGAAITISTMKAMAQLKLPLNVLGIVAATDNMPSGRAYHPGDVVDT